MNALLKYQKVRHLIWDGDIIVCKSDKLVAKTIQWFDNADYHHSGVIFKSYGRLFVMDAHPDGGVHPGYLSHRIIDKEWTDFTILRPKVKREVQEEALERSFEKANRFIPYNWRGVFKIAWWVFTGVYKAAHENGKQICSHFTQEYVVNCGIESHDPLNVKRPFFTPQDHLRNKDKFKVVV